METNSKTVIIWMRLKPSYVHFRNFHKDRLQNIENKLIRNTVSIYLHYLNQGYIPKQIFDEHAIRASSLQIKGDKNNPLPPYSIENLKEKLIDDNLILKCDGDYNLCKFTAKFFNDFKNIRRDLISKPTFNWFAHNFVAKKLFKVYKKVIAYEVPVWKYLEDNENIIGRLDLLIYDGSLFVADYKATENLIIRHIPQIASYGILIKEKLLAISKAKINIDVKCLGFSKDCAYEFKPDILKSVFLDYITEIENKMNEPIMRKSSTDLTINTRLIDDLKILCSQNLIQRKLDKNLINYKKKEISDDIKKSQVQRLQQESKKIENRLRLADENILKVLSTEWNPLDNFISKFRIYDKWDKQYLNLKLKGLSRKEKVKSKMMDGKEYWKLV